LLRGEIAPDQTDSKTHDDPTAQHDEQDGQPNVVSAGGIFLGDGNADQSKQEHQHHEDDDANVDRFGMVPRQNDFAKDRCFVQRHVMNWSTNDLNLFNFTHAAGKNQATADG